MAATQVVLSVSMVANFLQILDLVDRVAFGRPMSPSEWRILLILGQQTDLSFVGCSYKSLKFFSGLSDDGLSRCLQRLAQQGFIEKQVPTNDQRMTCYRLSDTARAAMARIGGEILRQMGAMMLALSAPLSNAREG